MKEILQLWIMFLDLSFFTEFYSYGNRLKIEAIAFAVLALYYL